MTQADFAEACRIPLPTLKDWWANADGRGAMSFAPAPGPSTPSSTPPSMSEPTPEPTPELAPKPMPEPTPALAPEPTPEPVPSASSSTQATELAEANTIGLSADMLRIVAEYERWHGTIPAFVNHLRSLGLRYGRQLVTQILHLAAARKLLRRPPPKPSTRGSTFRPPPGVQWTSDGKQVDVIVDGQTFRVTWQPTVDVDAAATVGSVVRPQEDTEGVCTSFAEGVETTGAPPVALLVDNKACNKTQVLADAVAPETFIMHSTPGRPENKAVIEGGFGLFSQALGPVVATVDTSTPEQIALDVAGAVTGAYAQGRNCLRSKTKPLPPGGS